MEKYRFFSSLAAVLTLLLCPASPLSAQYSWCGTVEYNRQFQTPENEVYFKGGASCPLNKAKGTWCDSATVRDTYIPGTGAEARWIRIVVHFVQIRKDDGTIEGIAPDFLGQINRLNEDYAPALIRFCYEVEQVNSTKYYYLDPSETHDMKNAYADQPWIKMNVFVADMDNYGGGVAGFATLPWTSEAGTNQGGIVGGQKWFQYNQSMLTHEMGHALGLYHDFHGGGGGTCGLNDEVDPCGPCGETVNDTISDRNYVGDLCADTDPASCHFNCGNPGSVDCAGTSWGTISFRNYMSYAQNNNNFTCANAFTPQQYGRMQCWAQNQHNLLVSYGSDISNCELMGIADSPKEKTGYLNQNIPNPVTGGTTITYHLNPGTRNAEILFYNLVGQLVRTVPLNAAKEYIYLEGNTFPGGVYFYALHTDRGMVDSKKMVVAD